MLAYTTVARNPATGSENRIHSDEEARRHGFRGGLVPGVTVYGYVGTALLAHPGFGDDWAGRGGASVRFRSPCYDGDQVEVHLSETGAGAEPGAEAPAGAAAGAGAPAGAGAGAPAPAPASAPTPTPAATPAEDPAHTGGRRVGLEVTVGEVACVTGWASVPAEAEAPPGRSVPWAAGPAPAREERPQASPASLAAGTVLGTIVVRTDVEAVAAYLDRIGAQELGGRETVHPGMLLEGANWVLSDNVVLPPWVHAGSEVRHYRAVAVGEPLEVAARVEREWQHGRGHRFVELDVAWTCEGELVATGRHVAIWQLAVAA